MYYYIYDSFVQNREFAKDLAMIETRLADFGISGNIGRLSLFRDAGELIADEVRRGAKTAVIVGNDSTIRKALEAVISSRVALGILPLGTLKENTFARIFGIPLGASAVDVLARRILVTLDVGKVNGRYFISRLRIPEHKLTIRLNNKFDVCAARGGSVEIKNIGWVDGDEAAIADPKDGMLEAELFVREGRRWSGRSMARSHFPFTDAVIEHDGASVIPAYVDEEEFAQPRFEVQVLKNRLRVIVGRDRLIATSN